jgi:hypothetical protein
MFRWHRQRLAKVYSQTRLKVNPKLRAIDLMSCQDHDMFVKTMSCFSRPWHVCQDHDMFVKTIFFKTKIVKTMFVKISSWLSRLYHVLQYHFQFDPFWSNLIQCDPNWSNWSSVIQIDPIEQKHSILTEFWLKAEISPKLILGLREQSSKSKTIRLFDVIPVTVQVGGGTQCGRQQCTQRHASLKSARARAGYTVAVFV